MNPVTGVSATPVRFGGGVVLAWVNPTSPGYDHVIILRKLTAGFSGPSDPTALVLYTGPGVQSPSPDVVYRPTAAPDANRHRTLLDIQNVQWGTTYYYAIYAMNAAESDPSAAALISAATPHSATLEELDVVAALSDYLERYFARQLVLGSLAVRGAVTTIPVLNGPPLKDAVTLPCIAVHLDADHPELHVLGDEVGELSATNDALVARLGFLSTVTISVTVWTDNPDTRRELYRTLKGAMIGARALLAGLGVANMTLSGQWQEEFERYNFPAFIGTLTMTGTLVSACVMSSPTALGTITVNEGTLTPVRLAG